MKRSLFLIILFLLVLISSILLAMPSVYPTGTTIYKPDKSWSGYTILMGHGAGTLIDMNGNVVKKWPDVKECKILPDGNILLSRGRGPGSRMVQMDFDDNIVWQFNKFAKSPGKVPGKVSGKSPAKKTPEGASGIAGLFEPGWASYTHHDFQREGSPAGYYSPELEPMLQKGKTLILANTESNNPRINSNVLRDDVIYEVTWDGKVTWKWVASEHVDEMGFSPDEFEGMQREKARTVDWFHANCASYIGPNKWYDGGDERFHPDNIITDSKTANILMIIEKKTGKIVWQIGPRYDTSPPLKKLGWIIGPHHTHMIPRGLPGAGNIMVFDNGGSGGYGKKNPINRFIVTRYYSRVVEFNPKTLEIVWEYSPQKLGLPPGDIMREFSPYISSAQRLPNGNTMITEGALGRVFEVTPELDVVWEYVSPYYGVEAPPPGSDGPANVKENQMVYRAYRVPYKWVPQINKPEEVPVIPPHNKSFRIDGSGSGFKGYVAQ